jgi:hypothetical protein
MAFAVINTTERAVYSENILPIFCNFNEPFSYNVESGSAFIENETERVYSGDRSMRVVVGGTTVIVWNTGGNETKFTAPYTGLYIFAIRVFIPTDFSESTNLFGLRYFANDLGQDPFDITLTEANGFTFGQWNTISQVAQLTQGDDVEFEFKLDSDTIGTKLFIDGFKVEISDKLQQGTPSIYSPAFYEPEISV